MREKECARVAGVVVGGDRLTGCAFAAQHTSQPPEAVERLAGLLVAGPPDEGQPRLQLGEVDVQRWRAVRQARRDRLAGVSSVGQVTTRDQPLAGPSAFPDAVFDRLEPAAQDGEDEPRLRGAGLVAAGLAQRQDPSRRPVPGGVVAAQHHRGEGGAAGRADQGAAWAVLEPDPQRFHGQPGVGGVVGDEGRRQDRVDQTGRGEQRGVGDVRPRQIFSGFGLVQPLVQAVELAVEFGGEPVRGRDGDAEFTQRLQAEPERLGDDGSGGSGCAPGAPSRPRGPPLAGHSLSIVRYASSARSSRPRP